MKVISKKNLKILLGIVLVLFLPFVLEKGYFLLFRNAEISTDFSFDRLLIFLILSIFIVLHLFYPINKIWEFIYKKRYYIGILIFIFIVANGYHGSSVYKYNSVIQPNYSIESNAPFFSYYKEIRSDEFLVDTPGILSQINYNQDLDPINDAIMAREGTTVYMFPQLPTKTISVISNPKLIGFLFLPMDQAFSFYWYILFFICFFATFEVSMLITKGRKIFSAVGACLLTFSPAFLWWNQLSIFASGFSAILFLHLFCKTNSKWTKLLYSILTGYAGSVYVMTLYPAWLIPFGWMFFGLVIWQLKEYKDKLKWKDLIYLIPVIGVMAIILLPGFIGSETTIKLMGETVYPGSRVMTGGYGWNLLYNYFIAPFYTIFKNIGNACEASQFIGFYPIPIFIAIWYIYKNIKEKRNDFLLNILTIIAILLSIWNYIDISIFSKIFLLTISTPDRAQLVVNMICILIVLRLIGCYEKNININFSLKNIIIGMVSIMIPIVGLSIVRNTYPHYVDIRVMIGSLMLYIPLFFCLIINSKRSNKIFSLILIAVSIFNFATVQPISRGLSVMYEKPIAKEISKITEIDKDAKWVVVNSKNTSIFPQNYILANGARVINSTNYYPNFDLWEKFDPDRSDDFVYNRYAHVTIDLTTEDTHFELLQADLFKVFININEIDKLDATYFVSPENLTLYSNDKYKFNELYFEDNLGIYRLEFIDSGVE